MMGVDMLPASRPRHPADPTGRWTSQGVLYTSTGSAWTSQVHPVCTASPSRCARRHHSSLTLTRFVLSAVRPPRPSSSTSPAPICRRRRLPVRRFVRPSSPPDLHLRHHDASRLDGPPRYHGRRIKASFPQRLDSRDFVQHICFSYRVHRDDCGREFSGKQFLM